MDRAAAERLIQESYGAQPEYLWERYPTFAVYRHGGNRKWFAVVMTIPRNRLGLEGNEPIDIVNLKADPLLIGSLCREAGIFPAYHMAKGHWISAALDGSVDERTLEVLIDQSFALTAPKAKRK